MRTVTRFRRHMLSALSCCGFLAGAAVAQHCTQHTLTQVDDTYAPNLLGNYFLVANFIDGGVTPNGVPDTIDRFNFTDCGPIGVINQQNTSPFSGMIGLADPTVMQIDDWFYVTGTSDDYRTGNFPIYRTKNFTSFELHMMAFAENDRDALGNPIQSQQWRYTAPGAISDTMRIGGTNGDDYSYLWAGSLFRDPTDTDENFWVHLTFSATQNSMDLYNDLSCFTVRIRKNDFLEWHNKDVVLNPNVDGVRFADPRGSAGFVAWFGYLDSNGQFAYDGGLSEGRLIPASGQPSILVGLGHLVPKTVRILCPSICGIELPDTQWGYQHVGVGANTWMVIDPSVWFDPNRAPTDPWKRVVTYVWDGRQGKLTTSPSGPQLNRDLQWGNNLAAASLTKDIYLFDTRTDLRSIAAARSNQNRIPVSGACGSYFVDNGAVGVECPSLNCSTFVCPGALELGEWRVGAVVEGATYFYSQISRRYYVIYTRNTWNSGAYQMVYRMTAPDRPFTDLFQNWTHEYGTPEHILLKPSASPFTARGSSYGSGEVFIVRDNFGVEHPYLAFHAKLEGQDNRTAFFKELTVDPQTGHLLELSPISFNPASNISEFRIPVQIQSAP